MAVVMSVLHWTGRAVRTRPASQRAEVKGVWIPKGQNVK